MRTLLLLLSSCMAQNNALDEAALGMVAFAITVVDETEDVVLGVDAFERVKI